MKRGRVSQLLRVAQQLLLAESGTADDSSMSREAQCSGGLPQLAVKASVSNVQARDGPLDSRFGFLFKESGGRRGCVGVRSYLERVL